MMKFERQISQWKVSFLYKHLYYPRKRLGRNPQPLLCLSLLFEIGVEVGEPGVGAACAGVGGVGFVGVGFAFEGDVAVGAVGVTVLDQTQKPFQ